MLVYVYMYVMLGCTYYLIYTIYIMLCFVLLRYVVLRSVKGRNEAHTSEAMTPSRRFSGGFCLFGYVAALSCLLTHMRGTIAGQTVWFLVGNGGMDYGDYWGFY